MIRQGWRFFECDGEDGCGAVFWRPTRDRFSPSCDSCECDEVVFPIKQVSDRRLAVDKSGNLLNPHYDITQKDIFDTLPDMDL